MSLLVKSQMQSPNKYDVTDVTTQFSISLIRIAEHILNKCVGDAILYFLLESKKMTINLYSFLSLILRGFSKQTFDLGSKSLILGHIKFSFV